MPDDTGENAGATNFRSRECDPHQNFRLVLVAFDGARRRGVEQEMLRSPARVSNLRRNMENQQVDVDADSGHKTANRAVLQFRRAGCPRGSYDVSRNDGAGDGLTKAAKRIPDYAGSHVRPHDLRREPVLGQEGELPRAGLGGRVDQHVDSVADAAVLEVAVQSVEFHAETEWQVQFGLWSDDIAIGCGEVPQIAAAGCA